MDGAASHPCTAAPSMLGRTMRVRVGSGVAGLKSSCNAAWVASPRSHLGLAAASNSLALRSASARSIREGAPEVG
eukprot:2042901-Lingulodinium_polyedra.AAC.1